MRFLHFLFLYSASLWAVAQNYSTLLNTTPVFVNEVNLSELKENQLYIAMPFAKRIILNPTQKKQLLGKAILKLALVYTKYRTSKSFNQKTLNNNRLIALNKWAPAVFKNRFWKFELISQTKANSSKSGKKLLHGFIITFRPSSTKRTLNLEATYLNKLTTTMLQKDSLKKEVAKNYKIKTHYDLNMGYIHDTIWYADTIKPPPPPPTFFYNQTLYQDSTVLNSFNRNKTWKNFIVVTDVTGSMSPYSAQVFVWLKNQAENTQVQSFIFFNDGDEKPSKRKLPLATNGIYSTKNIALNSVVKTAAKCMQNGSGGGEGLENDIEAIIKGIKQQPTINEIILIADNMESMRDYEFIKDIKKPVHIIVCGAENRINIQYLDLARKTNGSVHTKKTDIINLQNIKENEHFFIEE